MAEHCPMLEPHYTHYTIIVLTKLSYSLSLFNISRLTIHIIYCKSFRKKITKHGGLNNKSPWPRNKPNCVIHARLADSKRKKCPRRRFRDLSDSSQSSERRRGRVDQKESSFIQKSDRESINNQFLGKR